MPSRENIIDNVEFYSAKDLHQFILDGVLSFEELCMETEGYLPADVRKELEELLEGQPVEETVVTPEPDPEATRIEEPQAASVPPTLDDWEMVDKTSDAALQAFIQTHPGHPMIPEANRLRNELFLQSWEIHDIDTLKTEINDIMTNKNVLDKTTKIVGTIEQYLKNGHITIEEFKAKLADDNNFVSATVIKKLIEEKGYFTFPDLLNLGISPIFVNELIRSKEQDDFGMPRPIDRINKVSTEIYFWGIPSSGKTCALGGILSMAKNGGTVRYMSQDPDCQGYGYMTRLADIFNENQSVGMLPPGTPIYAIYEMGFDLEDPEGKIHPITCIDLAGELTRIMYKNDAGENLSEEELITLETVTNLLVSNRTTNRKIHFFVLEYGGEERLYEGLGQATYLNAALEYIKRTKIFEKETDGIFLLFTKVDKTKLRGRELVEHLTEYTEKYYSNFYNGLVSICRQSEINGGKVDRLPFTLGSVCFQNFCKFDGGASENVVKKILERSKGFRQGKFQKLINKVKQ